MLPNMGTFICKVASLPTDVVDILQLSTTIATRFQTLLLVVVTGNSAAAAAAVCCLFGSRT